MVVHPVKYRPIFAVRGRIFAHSEQAHAFSTSFSAPGHQDIRCAMLLVAWIPGCVSWPDSLTNFLILGGM